MAAGYSLSVAHAAFNTNPRLPSITAAKPRGDQTPKPPVVVQARFIPPVLVKTDDGTRPTQVEWTKDNDEVQQDRGADYPPLFIPRPRSRPDASRAPRRLDDFGTGQIDLSLTHKPNLARPSYAPRLRSIPPPIFPRDKVLINPIPGYLIGVFR